MPCLFPLIFITPNCCCLSFFLPTDQEKNGSPSTTKPNTTKQVTEETQLQKEWDIVVQKIMDAKDWSNNDTHTDISNK